MYTGRDTQLIEEIDGVDVSGFTRPSRLVLTLAQDLLKQGYPTGINNYFSSPELLDFLAKYETNAVGTVRRNRKNLPQNVMQKKVKKRGRSCSLSRKTNGDEMAG